MSEALVAEKPEASIVRRRWLTRLWIGLALLVLLAGLYLVSLHNYLLYHSLAEIFSIIVAYSTFTFAWNCRRYLENNFLVFLGIAFLGVAMLDTLHMFAYRGANVFGTAGANLATELWLAARYLNAFSFLAAALLVGRTVQPYRALAGYVVIVILLICAIFWWGGVPDAYVEGVGLTPFKKVSEYVISAIFLLSAIVFMLKRRALNPQVLRLLVVAIVLTIISELTFTLYVGVYDFFNFLGHYLKIIAFYLIYMAILERGLTHPFALLFRGLQKTQRELEGERQHLEERVTERTAELQLANERLRVEMEQHLLAERAVEHREQRFRHLVENANNIILQFDLQGRLTFFNAYAQRLFGYRSEDVLGHHANILLPPESREGQFLENLIEHIISAPEKFAYNENENVTRDGRRLWISWTNQITYDEAGGMIGIMSIGTDQTAQREAQQALRQSEERFRLFMEYLPAFAFMKDEQGRYVYINRYAREQFGKNGEEMLGKTDREVWSSEVAEVIEPDDERVRQTGEPTERVEHLGLPNRRLTVASYKFRITGPQGQPYIGGVARDITEVVEAQQALADSERRYRELVENASSVVLLMDAEGNIRLANAYAHQLFGYDQGELVGQHVSVLLPEKEESGRSLEGLVEAVLANPDQYQSFENENLTRDGRRLWMAWSNRVVLDSDAKVEGVMAIGIDRTRQHHAEQELLENQQRLRRLATELSLAEERERRRLATEIHDNLSQTLALAKMRLAALRRVAEAAPLLDDLQALQELVDEAVANTRSVTFELSPPILYQVGLEAAVEWLAGQIQTRHGITVNFLNDEQPKPLAEEVRVAVFAAVRELFANMVKHAQARNCWVRMEAVDNMLQVVVEDDGVGFDPARAVWTAEQGSGFGLFNIKERLEYVGGGLTIVSKPGAGAKFTLRVPLSETPQQ